MRRRYQFNKKQDKKCVAYPATTQMASSSGRNNFTNNLLSKLRYDAETADVMFIFDVPSVKNATKQEITAHEAILAGGSRIFRSMFYGMLKETEDIQITDFSYDGFSEFISLFYVTDPVLSKESIFEVMRAVDKYDARDCLAYCESLLNAMDKDNVCDVLEVTVKINLSKAISDKAAALIGKNTVDVFASLGFRTCVKEVLKQILNIETLSCVNESAVCHAAMDWADNVCREKDLPATVDNKRAELSECFQLIRFAAMDIEEFLELEEVYPQLFTYEEFQEMVQHKIRGQPLKLLAHLSCTKRKYPTPVPTPAQKFEISNRLNDVHFLQFV